MKNRFNALIAGTNGPFHMEQEGRIVVHNATVQICIDRKKTVVRPDAAMQVAAGAKDVAEGNDRV